MRIGDVELTVLSDSSFTMDKRRSLADAARRHSLIIPIHNDQVGYLEQQEQGLRFVAAS